jgi:hypothetical protein
MFFKKRREAKKAREAEVRQIIIDGFQERIDEAQNLPDPGERILKLQEVAEDVDAVVDEMSGKAAMSAKTKQRIMFWTAMPAGIVASAIYPPALLGLLGMGASVYGGGKLSKKFGERARQAHLEKERPFLKKLEAQKEKALAIQDALVIQDSAGVATSKHFTDLLAKVPRLREQFAVAYSRKVTEEQAQKQAPAAKKWYEDPNHKF